jgi:hypothetical protein
VIGQCADANFREKNYSLIPALLKKVDTKYFDADSRSEFQQLQAFVDCQSSSNPATCVPPPAKFQTSATEAALSKAKLAGQNAIPNQAHPGRLRDAPAPEALSCE